jgi:hypothetical protein
MNAPQENDTLLFDALVTARALGGETALRLEITRKLLSLLWEGGYARVCVSGNGHSVTASPMLYARPRYEGDTSRRPLLWDLVERAGFRVGTANGGVHYPWPKHTGGRDTGFEPGRRIDANQCFLSTPSSWQPQDYTSILLDGEYTPTGDSP